MKTVVLKRKVNIFQLIYEYSKTIWKLRFNKKKTLCVFAYVYKIYFLIRLPLPFAPDNIVIGKNSKISTDALVRKFLRKLIIVFDFQKKISRLDKAVWYGGPIGNESRTRKTTASKYRTYRSAHEFEFNCNETQKQNTFNGITCTITTAFALHRSTVELLAFFTARLFISARRFVGNCAISCDPIEPNRNKNIEILYRGWYVLSENIEKCMI